MITKNKSKKPVATKIKILRKELGLSWLEALKLKLLIKKFNRIEKRMKYYKREEKSARQMLKLYTSLKKEGKMRVYAWRAQNCKERYWILSDKLDKTLIEINNYL